MNMGYFMAVQESRPDPEQLVVEQHGEPLTMVYQCLETAGNSTRARGDPGALAIE